MRFAITDGDRVDEYDYPLSLKDICRALTAHEIEFSVKGNEVLAQDVIVDTITEEVDIRTKVFNSETTTEQDLRDWLGY